MDKKKADNTGIWRNLEDFVKKFKKASDIIKMEKPDYIIAPLVGAAPFIDILAIIDKHFPLNNVHYLPNSSRFANRNELDSKWYSNFYKNNDIGEKIKLISLDEVRSGSSAVNGYKQFRKSLEDRAREKAKGLKDELEAIEHYKHELDKKIDYKILGFAEKGYNRNNAFTNLVNKHKVHLLEFDQVYTIDNIMLNTIRLKQRGENPNGRITYLPEIESFDVTGEYINFLQNVATCIGEDPKTVGPVNLSRIKEGLEQAK